MLSSHGGNGHGASRHDPVRVAFLAKCVRGGGAGWSMYYLLKHLDRERIEPLVVLPAAGIFADRYADLGIEVVVPDRFPENSGKQRFSSDNSVTRALSLAANTLDVVCLIPRLAMLFRRRGIEAVYCNNLTMHAVGAPAAQLGNASCVLHARNLPSGPLRRVFCRTLARLPAVRRVIANSSATAETYAGLPDTGLPDGCVSVIHNGVDLTEYEGAGIANGSLRQELGIAPDKIVVGYTGRVEPRKGIDVLIEAASTVLKQRPEAVFVVVGDAPASAPAGYRAQCEARARNLGIADRFIFAGFRKDVRPALADFDIHCMPSYWEPFGRSIIEAMAMALPVVACRSGGVPEIVTHNIDGLLVEPGDSDELADALGRLADDEALRRRLGHAAQARVRDRFDVAKLTRRMEEVILAAATRQ